MLYSNIFPCLLTISTGILTKKDIQILKTNQLILTDNFIPKGKLFMYNQFLIIDILTQYKPF